MNESPSSDAPAGWYEESDGLRYWDGSAWTAQRAPKPPPPPLSQRAMASAVLLGVLAAWFVIWLLAQIAPDTFYLPVKFVVEDLPNF
jgi:hypothetical protein